MKDDPEHQALKELLLHLDPGHRAQGVALMSALGPEAASAVFETPRVDKDRPAVSFLTGYLVTPELLSAWAGHQREPWPWVVDLKRLDLAGQFRLTDLNGLGALGSLEWLDLRSCVHLTDVTGLQHLTSLTWLRLASCRALPDLKGLNHLNQLRELDLSRCDAVEDLTSLASLTALTTLNLERCKKVTDLGPLEGLPNLEHLHLGGCQVVTDADTTTYEPLLSCPNLKSVTMGYASNAQKEACVRLQEHCQVILEGWG